MLSRTTSPAHRALRDEAGFTLIEMMIAIAIFAVLLGATLIHFSSAEQAASKDTEAATSAAEARDGLHRMVRDLRQATAVLAAEPNTLHVLVGGGREVRYSCGLADPADSRFRQCRRDAGPEGTLPAPGGGQVVVARILNGTADRPVFAYTVPPAPADDPEDEAADPADPAVTMPPTYVRAAIAVPAAGERRAGGYRHEVVYDAGLYLRNIDYGSEAP